MKYSENDYNERHAECPAGMSISHQHPYKAGCHPGIFVEVNEGADRIEPLKIKREPYGSELLAG